MFAVSVETHFWASHQLTLPDGSRESLHCHNWMVAASVSSSELDSMGLVMDFQQLKALINNIVADFDNAPLEENGYFQRNSSSAENVARYIFEKLEPKLPKRVKLEHIRVTEEPGCGAKFGR